MSFSTGVREMMFSAGDSENTNTNSLEFMENLTRMYIRDLSIRASRIAMIKGKLDDECFSFLFRNDKLRSEKIKELMDKSKKIKKTLKRGKTVKKDVLPGSTNGDILSKKETVTKVIELKKPVKVISEGIECNNGEVIYGHFDKNIPVNKLEEIQIRRYRTRVKCVLDTSEIYEIMMDNVVNVLIREVENGFGDGSLKESSVNIVHVLSKMFICDVVEYARCYQKGYGSLSPSELLKASETLKGFLYS